MVYSEFPVEQLARLASSPFQIGFARQAMRMLAPSDFIAFEATQDGLLMRAQNEDALAKPLTLLRDLYRDNLVLPPPQIAGNRHLAQQIAHASPNRLKWPTRSCCR